MIQRYVLANYKIYVVNNRQQRTGNGNNIVKPLFPKAPLVAGNVASVPSPLLPY